MLFFIFLRVAIQKLTNACAYCASPWPNVAHPSASEGYDDGVFIGGRGSGKGLHVDQVPKLGDGGPGGQMGLPKKASELNMAGKSPQK